MWWYCTTHLQRRLCMSIFYTCFVEYATQNSFAIQEKMQFVDTPFGGCIMNALPLKVQWYYLQRSLFALMRVHGCEEWGRGNWGLQPSIWAENMLFSGNKIC